MVLFLNRWRNIDPDKLVKAVLWFFAAFIILSTIYGVFRVSSGNLFADHWAIVSRAKIMVEQGGGLSFLAEIFRQHNEHRIPLHWLFFIFDLLILNDGNKFIWILIIGNQFLLLVFFGIACQQKINHSNKIHCFLFPVFAILFFSFIQIENFSNPFQISFIGNQLGFIGALFFFLTAAIQPSESKKSIWFFIASILFGLYSTFSLASGLFVWPFLVLITWIFPFSKAKRAFMLAFMVGIFSGYFATYHSIPGHSNPINSLSSDNLSKIFSYMLVYIGGPILRLFEFGKEDSEILFIPLGIGLFGFMSALFFNAKQFKDREKDFSLFFLFIVDYILLMAFFTGSGRVNFGLWQATSSRYFTPVFCFWASLFSLFLFEIQKKRQNLSPVVISFLLTLSFLFVINQPRYVHDNKLIQLERQQTKLAYLVGIACDIDPGIANLEPFLRDLRIVAPHFFEDREGALLGESFSERFKIVSTDRITGFFDQASPKGCDKNQGLEVRGWAYDLDERNPVKRVVFTAENDRIVGWAKYGTYRPDVKEALAPKKNTALSGWRGFVKPGVPLAELKCYALKNNSDEAVLLPKSF